MRHRHVSGFVQPKILIEQPKRLEKPDEPQTSSEQSETWTVCTANCIGWPSVEWVEGAPGDERLQALAKLRALTQ
jgi:hypothetical protein